MHGYEGKEMLVGLNKRKLEEMLMRTVCYTVHIVTIHASTNKRI
jgi:hypothetical protein